MRVTVVNAYDRHNAGDAALLSALIDQIRLVDPAADISFAGLESPILQPEFEGVRNLGSLRRWAGEDSVTRGRRIRRKLLAVMLALLPTWALRRLGAGDRHPGGDPEPLGEIRAIARADLVVGLGGGYMNGSASWSGTLNVFFLLLPLWLSSRLGRPTILAPQSYGPFGRPAQVRMVRACLNRVDLIVVREDPSLDQLRRIGVHEHLLTRGVDSAFTLGEIGVAPATDQDSDRPRVGITARAWLPGPAQDSYERALAGFVDWLQTVRGATVTLIPQVTADYQGDDDRIVARRVASHCITTPCLVDGRLDHRTLCAVYADLDFLVGTRFHSVIFGLLSGTPALAIEYEHKTSGIMGDLGLSEWVIPIREVSDTALRMRFLDLEAARPAYERQIKERLPDYVDRANDFVTVLRRAVA